MANIVNLDRVSKGYGAAGQLLVDVSLGLSDDDRVGVVGLNGAGKSTLLRLLTRVEEPDAGRVTHRRDLRVAWLPQTLELPPDATVRDIVLGTAWLPEGFTAEHEWAGDAGVRAILTGLGMGDLGMDATIGPMSGGERRRVLLAALLVRESDLLVLDEPTNHLDVAGVDWLARHLLERSSRRSRSSAGGASSAVGKHSGLVVVTHDRWFLDAVCTSTWEVADQTVRAYEGGFAAWTLARMERERVAAATEARRQNLLRKEIAWLRRGPPARTSKPRFRIEAANALIADVPAPRDAVSLRRLATARLGKQVYDLTDVSVSFGDRPILRGVTWQVGPGDRIGIVGANGAGKTTLLRLLAGVRTPDSGRLVTGVTVRPAFLSQELAELAATGREAGLAATGREAGLAATGREAGLAATGREAGLAGHLRVLEAVEEVARRVTMGDRELSAAQLAEVFGFVDRYGPGGGRTGSLWTPVADLSGGERRRLQMLRLLAGEPNVLLLDEPTNDLDTDTLAALEDMLDSWPGTLIVASHDRYLVERVTDAVYGMFGDGALVHLPGGVDEYLAKVTGTLSPRRPQPSQSGGSAATGATDGYRATSGGESRASVASADSRALKKELARLERQVGKLEQREAQLHDQLASHATDYEKVAALDGELRAVRADRARTEDEWLTVAEQLPE